MALAHCGISAYITDVETDNTPEAISCRLFYTHCIETLIEMQEWQFCWKQEALSSLGSPPDGWAYRYAYPSDCKLALRIVNSSTRNPGRGETIPFKIVNRTDSFGKAILTDYEDAVLEYNQLVTDENLFSSAFVTGLSFMLAVMISTPLRVSASVKTEVRRDYASWLSEAMTKDFREATEDDIPDSEFVTIR